MAHRRTRAEKTQAKHIYVTEVKQEDRIKLKSEPIKSADVSTITLYPELSKSTASIKTDLTKTLIVTILALISQFSLATYLQKGGWNTLQTFIEKIF